VRGLRRRLGFEVMEGRCLLSAATLQFSPFSLPEVQDTSQVSLITIVGGQQAASSPIVEGGYINLGGLQSQSATNYGQWNNHVLPISAGAGVGGGGIADLLDADSTVTFSDSITNPITNFDTVNVGAGLRPVVISPTIGGSLVTRNVDPGRSLVAGQERGRQEGGIVQIDQILNGDKRFDSDQIAASIIVDDTTDESSARENSLADGARLPVLRSDSGARVPALASAGTELAVSLNQRASDLTAPAKSSVITGELARAVVFELAGGEPAWIRPVVISDKIKSVAPADSQDSRSADAPPVTPAAAQQASLRASTSRIRLNGNQVEFPLPADDWVGWNAIERRHAVSQHAESELGANPGGLAALGVPDTAVAEVFEQLGGSQQPPVRGTFEDDAQTGPLVAGSVIALLMLERAAARYKSRTERQTLTVVAGPPRI
jgi:hypothetical protein